MDAYWPDAQLAVEVDSRNFHATPLAFEEDRRRDRRLAARGIQVTRVTRRDFEDTSVWPHSSPLSAPGGSSRLNRTGRPRGALAHELAASPEGSVCNPTAQVPDIPGL